MNISTGMILRPPLQNPANTHGNDKAFPFTSLSFHPSSGKSSISLRKPGFMCLHSKALQCTGVARFNKDFKEVSVHDKHINKEVIALTPQLYDYILANVREPQILRELREETSRMSGSQMQVSPDQAQLLAMLVQVLGAQWCIEGYSSLAVALVLPETGRLVACERDANCLAMAKRYYQRAGVLGKVEVRHALAIDTLHDLLNHGEANRYDFAFVDAEKKMNGEYYELLLQLIRPGGLIVIDNVLWYGRVANPQIDDKRTNSIRDFNKLIYNDKRVTTSMIPIGDGMTLCRKK
ncbi:uncharacterized protein LOC131050876 isoform X2 [Cryptomeria japonica]|uniref:uncharacterized protein LOC131050876 isoform X2 n=1 Tax=Cryptomeria japonica TaxID=3369 RepID=UPI0027DA91ED|nr:uncharacterized protein LOC131050876 isoform X2 [Cryptomeria japonica]